MELEDWGNRWRDDMIGWHQADISYFLTKYAEQIWGDKPTGSVYVPLCGKTLDMVFLAEYAKSVVGVEYAEKAIDEFFAERGLEPEVGTEAPVRYSADNYVLFAGDYYAVTNEHAGPIDAVLDRASLVAVNPETRMQYADHMRSLLAPGAKMLLIVFSYDQSEMSGPPWSVPADEVQRLYTDGFEIEHLETRDATDDMFRSRGLSMMMESAYLLTRR